MSVCFICKNGASSCCTDCKAVIYCGKECQQIDYKSTHKESCENIVKSRMKLDEIEKYFKHWETVICQNEALAQSEFENKEKNMEKYDECKVEYIHLLMNLGTETSLKLAEAQANEYMTTDRSYCGMEISKEISVILLKQKNREQDCYDFIRWCTNRRFMRSNNDILEPVPDTFYKIQLQQTGLPFLVSLMIIKLRIYHRFDQFRKSFYSFLHGTTDGLSNLDKLRGNYLVLTNIFEFACYVPPNVVLEKPTLNMAYCTKSIEELKIQIQSIFESKKSSGYRIWKALLNPKPILETDFKNVCIYTTFVLNEYAGLLKYILDEMGESSEVYYSLVGSVLTYDTTFSDYD